MTTIRWVRSAVIALALFSAPAVANAALLPACARESGGCVELNQLIQLGVNYGRFLLGLSGSVALVFFVWGGFLMLTSAGSSKKVEEGKTKMVAAIVGLIIIFSAFTVVKFAFKFLDPTGKYEQYVTKPPPARR